MIGSARNESSLPKDSQELHRLHYHYPKNHTSRHHRKHEKMAAAGLLINSIVPTSTEPVVSEVRPTAEVRNESTTAKPRKTANKRPRPREPFGEADEDRTHRRRKVHHHRKNNNTLLTNSVHDDTLNLTLTDVDGTTSSSISSSSSTTAASSALPHRHHHLQNKYSTTTASDPTSRSEGEHLFSQGLDRAATESIAQTTNYTTSTESISATPTEVNRIAPVEQIQYSSTTETTLSTSSTVQTSTTANATAESSTTTTKRPQKIHRNKNHSTLGPARIDVTILESADRRHKQGSCFFFIFSILLQLFFNNYKKLQFPIFQQPTIIMLASRHRRRATVITRTIVTSATAKTIHTCTKTRRTLPRRRESGSRRSA